MIFVARLFLQHLQASSLSLPFSLSLHSAIVLIARHHRLECSCQQREGEQGKGRRNSAAEEIEPDSTGFVTAVGMKQLEQFGERA